MNVRAKVRRTVETIATRAARWVTVRMESNHLLWCRVEIEIDQPFAWKSGDPAAKLDFTLISNTEQFPEKISTFISEYRCSTPIPRRTLHPRPFIAH